MPIVRHFLLSVVNPVEYESLKLGEFERGTGNRMGSSTEEAIERPALPLGLPRPPLEHADKPPCNRNQPLPGKSSTT